MAATILITDYRPEIIEQIPFVWIGVTCKPFLALIVVWCTLEGERKHLSQTNLQNVIRGVSANFFSCIDSYEWPGNVREFKNVVQRAVINCQGDILDIKHLPKRLMNGRYADITIPVRVGLRLAEIKKEVIIRTLQYAGNNRTKAILILGISRRAFYNKIQKV